MAFVELSELYGNTHPFSPTIVFTGIGFLPHPSISTHTELPVNKKKKTIDPLGHKSKMHSSTKLKLFKSLSKSSKYLPANH